ncbi:putative U-box domain-containing protein 58 [Cryptomeria japonica]|uniref:putative U-box domain-containing protein 58 n=1 Tax=Cryptomeria japonica TaxID=3369 RepID=UPI0027DA5BE4|nr:putative U-box domain-containing protein 58 [Cryptomeria japonica]
MKEEEKITDYLQRVKDSMSSIRALGEDVKDEVIVKKVMRSLTSKYDTKVSAIEEAINLNTFSMDELFGSLSIEEEREINLFMQQEVVNDVQVGSDEEEEFEVIVDLEGELISALEELIKLEGIKRMCEVTKSDLEDKEKEHQNLEQEIVSLKKELEK